MTSRERLRAGIKFTNLIFQQSPTWYSYSSTSNRRSSAWPGSLRAGSNFHWPLVLGGFFLSHTSQITCWISCTESSVLVDFTGGRFGDSEAVVKTGPLLRHAAALWPHLPQADPRGANYSASDEGMFPIWLKGKLLGDFFLPCTLNLYWINIHSRHEAHLLNKKKREQKRWKIIHLNI